MDLDQMTELTKDYRFVNQHVKPVALSADCSSNVKQYAYGLLVTPAQNLSPPTFLMQQQKLYGQNIHHRWNSGCTNVILQGFQ